MLLCRNVTKDTLNIAKIYLDFDLNETKGVGEGGGGSGGLCPRTFKSGGAQVGLSPPTFDRPSVVI